MISVVGWIIHIVDNLGDTIVLAQRIDPRVIIKVIDSLAGLAKWLLGVVVIDRILYLIAPSAEQATKMIQVASLIRGSHISYGSKPSNDGPKPTPTDAGVTTTTTTSSVPNRLPDKPPSQR